MESDTGTSSPGLADGHSRSTPGINTSQHITVKLFRILLTCIMSVKVFICGNIFFPGLHVFQT